MAVLCLACNGSNGLFSCAGVRYGWNGALRNGSNGVEGFVSVRWCMDRVVRQSRSVSLRFVKLRNGMAVMESRGKSR